VKKSGNKQADMPIKKKKKNYIQFIEHSQRTGDITYLEILSNVDSQDGQISDFRE
jgi:hypothetical protein